MNLQVRRWSLAFFLASFSLMPRLARASDFAANPDAPVRRFGDRGEFAVSSATQLSLGHTSFSATEMRPITTFFATTAVDYFVVRGFSAGVRVSYEHLDQAAFPAANSLSFGPRVGYNVDIGEHFSFWPDADAVYAVQWGGGQPSSRFLTFGIYAPFLYHPVSHLFLGLGPEIAHTIASFSPSDGAAGAPQSTTYGILATVGGWVGP
jgi:hypothetical protein